MEQLSKLKEKLALKENDLAVLRARIAELEAGKPANAAARMEPLQPTVTVTSNDPEPEPEKVKKGFLHSVKDFFKGEI